MNGFDQQALTREAIDLLALSPDDVWVAQLANGGNASRGGDRCILRCRGRAQR